MKNDEFDGYIKYGREYVMNWLAANTGEAGKDSQQLIPAAESSLDRRVETVLKALHRESPAEVNERVWMERDASDRKTVNE